MTKTVIFQPMSCKLKELNNLFIELTAKNCNQRCKHCYIDFPMTKSVRDFISIDLIKKALIDTCNENIQCIYLTGAEPMTHPDFNAILRLCLKYNNTCICTNATFINEKKARFLRNVEDESQYEIIFKLSIDHYDEMKNDAIRSRGSYRQVLHAIKYLIKYGFNPILEVTNYYNEDFDVIMENFKYLLSNNGFNANEKNICINEWYDKSIDNFDSINKISGKLDCEYGRILTVKGVYTCPFLANDYRGRCGNDFADYSNKNVLETKYCNTCLKNKKQVFGINFSNFI